MAAKEKNYISAVIYLGNEKGHAKPFLQEVTSRLSSRFEYYELVFVNDASVDGTEQEVREFLSGLESPPPVTMIHMSLSQGLELAMNAGIDMAIGDFVFEFDSMQLVYPGDMIDKAYDTSLREAADIVMVVPAKNRTLFSSVFYNMFRFSGSSNRKLQTNAFRLLSRRAINRVHSISPTMPYRKAAYAASGLKLETLRFEGTAGKFKEDLRFSRAMDSLVLYTEMGYKVSLGISALMLLLMIGSMVYTLVFYLSGAPLQEGWTTTMMLLTGGFFGVFVLLSIVMKYLSLLVDLIFKKQKYLIESVEKIS